MINVGASIRNQGLKRAEAARRERNEAIAQEIMNWLEDERDETIIPWLLSAAPSLDPADGCGFVFLSRWDSPIFSLASRYRYVDDGTHPVLELADLSEFVDEPYPEDQEWELKELACRLSELLSSKINTRFREWQDDGYFAPEDFISADEMECDYYYDRGL